MIDFYPCLVYYIEDNPDYNQPVEVDTPTKDHYAIVLSDWMTLGRQPIPYEEWVDRFIQQQKIILQHSSKCEFRVNKIAVGSFDDIVEFKSKNPKIRFVNNELNNYFRVEQ